MCAVAVVGILALSACALDASDEIIEPAGGAPSPAETAPPSIEVPESENEFAVDYRPLGEPVGSWTCDDLVPNLPGESARTVGPPRLARDTSIDGMVVCDVVVETQSGASFSINVFVADLGSAAVSRALQAQGAVLRRVDGFDLVRSSDCPARCHGAVAVNGFVAEHYTLGSGSASREDERAIHDVISDSLAVELRTSARPDPLRPVDPSTAPLTECASAPPSLQADMGRILGGDGPAVATEWGSGDGASLSYHLDDLRGATHCAWFPNAVAASTDEPAVLVNVVPGATELIGVPGFPFEDTAPSTYSSDIGGVVVTVSGVDEVTADAIIEAHRG